MKVSGIIAVASLCLAGLIEAAPVAEKPESKIVKIDENGERIDFEYVSNLMEPFIKRLKTGKASPIIEKDEVLFIEQVMKEIEEHYFKEEFDEVPLELTKRTTLLSLNPQNVGDFKDVFGIIWRGLKAIREATKCEGQECIY